MELGSFQFSDQVSYAPDIKTGGPQQLLGMVVGIEKELREERVLRRFGHIE